MTFKGKAVGLLHPQVGFRKVRARASFKPNMDSDPWRSVFTAYTSLRVGFGLAWRPHVPRSVFGGLLFSEHSRFSLLGMILGFEHTLEFRV